MNNNKEDLQKEIDKKYEKRDKKKKAPMKVSGRSVIALKKIIEKK